MSEQAIVEIISPDEAYQEALDIRYRVFVEGQNVPLNLEQDGEDHICTHFLIRKGEQPIGAGRLRKIDDSVVKIERMAVLKEYRNAGYGRKMLDRMLEFAGDQHYSKVTLHAQLPAVHFYEKAQFQKVGEIFYEAGIPHISMEKEL